MNQERSDLKENTLSSNTCVDATTNLEKFWPLGDTVMGPQGEMFSPNFNRPAIYILFFVLVLSIPVYKGKYMLLTVASNFQCVLDKAVHFAWS